MQTDTKSLQEALAVVIERLENSKEALESKKVVGGFDGFVDSLVRVVREKPEEGLSEPGSTYFRSIREFGEYIVQKSNASFSLETEEIANKLGGNMPIMANALAGFGPAVACIGAFGVSAPHSIFNTLHSRCEIYSYANPGITSALEFGDGKIMLGEMKELNRSRWETVREAIGLKKLVDLWRNRDVAFMVNWSEPDGSTSIWKGILAEVFPALAPASYPKSIFFDLSDCSRRSSTELKNVLTLISSFQGYSKVILSLNKNEALLVHAALSAPTSSPLSLERLPAIISEKLGIQTVVLHTTRESFGAFEQSTFQAETFYVESPKISTGAGDNFNAGYCLGELLSLHPKLSLILANAVSAFYVSHGASPTYLELVDWLKELNSTLRRTKRDL